MAEQWSKRAAGVVLAYVAVLLGGCSDTPPPSEQHAQASIPLVTGRYIDPHPDASHNVGSIPINLIASPDGRYAICTDQGFRQALWVLRTEDGSAVSEVQYPRSGADGRNGLYYGIAIGSDRTVYAAQGNRDSIAVLTLSDDGKLNHSRSIATRKGDFPSGLFLDNRGYLYVANNDPIGGPGLAFQKPGSVSIYDATSGSELSRFEFTDSFGGTPNFPLAVAAMRDGSKLFVSSQRDAAVYVLDTHDPAKPSLRSRIETGSHPVCLLFDKSQSRLFVANAQSDTVSVVDPGKERVTATILLRPEIAKDVAGATPMGMALSPDEKTLYVAMGDLNAVAVVDATKAELLGYIPAGWYPTSVVASPDNKRLFVANAKGDVVRHPNPPTTSAHQVSPLALLEGNVMTIPVPSDDELPNLTQKVLELARLTPRYVKADNPLREIGLKAGKIRHVIYIVKENRTYDQVLSDLPQGNGDPNRCIFGREITPNLHALAERFVLLDNFYDCGEVSGDGWTWSTQAQAGEYIIRNVPYSYSDRGRSYDYEGQVADYPAGGFPAKGPDGKPLSEDPRYQNGAPPVPDVGEASGGHIWDLARRHGLSYRNYGFFYSDGIRNAEKKQVIPDNYPNSMGLQPGGHDLEGVSDVDFRRFDLDYSDSEAPLRYAERTKDEHFLRPRRGYGKHQAPSRFSEWKIEFEQMLAMAPDGSAVPAFLTIRFPNDHTMGTNPLKHSPRSMVADNDYAIGQFVERISHSPIWKSCAIFIVEDDAQNGPDHVDAHRSTCYVISPWIKAHSVDHTFQNTVSVLKTMELLLNLPPMCQYDATATPILDWDTSPSNAEPYAAILPDQKWIRQLNGEKEKEEPVSPEQKAMMEESSRMDFAHADQAPAERLNEIIWKSVKGADSLMPPTPRGPNPMAAGQRKKDDDD